MRLNGMLFASVSLAALTTPYEPNKAGWKTGEGGSFELKDGNPIFVDKDGNERVVEIGTVSTLIGENKNYRERAQTAENALKVFEGIDAEAARKALETVGKLDQNKLIEAGKLDEVKAEIEGRYKTQIDAKDKALAEATQRIEKMILDNAFASSDFISKRVAIPSDLLVNTFRDNFKIENDKLVPYGPDGKIIYSDARIGEVATFDEALSQMINARPDKDKLLLANPGNGSGNDGGGGNRGGDGRVYTRSEFNTKSPAEKSQIALLVREGKAQLVD